MLPNAPTGIIPWNARLTNYPWLYNHVARLSGTCHFGPGDVLIRTRSANEWTGSDFTRPTDRPVREIDFLGRHCWEVELAPPSYKPAPIQLVVDVATGTVLEPGRCFPRSPDATANW